MKLRLVSQKQESFKGRQGEEKTSSRCVFIGAELDFAEQLLEMNRPADAQPLTVGNTYDVTVREVTSIFGGKPRIRGEINGGEVAHSDLENEARERGGAI